MEEMRVGTKGFYDLMKQFEKDMQEMTYGHSLDRETKGTVPKGIFYCDGFVNNMFHAYMRGYQHCRINTILEQ